MMPRIIPLICMAVVLAACGGATPAPAQTAGSATIATESRLIGDAGRGGIPQIGQAAPDFQYTLPDGTTHKLSDLRGKRVLLNFWATWCAPCRSEMPDIQKALGEAGGSVAVLGVNKGELIDVIAPFVKEVGVTFPLIVNPESDIASRYAAINLPTSYFINTDGTIGLRKTGVMNYGFIKSHLDQLK